MSGRRFLFTCGGTAGHINPAVGVAGRLQALLPDAEFLFIGAEGMMETELVPREGYAIRTIEISNLSRSLSLAGLKHNLHTARTLLTGERAAKALLRDFAPDVAIGTGGYVCYPVLRAAHALGIPTLVHESNAVPGLTTKLLAGTVDCVMVGFADAAENYPKGTNVVFTGTPVRGDFETIDREAARRALGIAPETPFLLSVWGSLGSDYMNGVMPAFMARVCRERAFAMLHSAGKRGYQKLAAAAAAACGGDPAAGGVDLREYIFNMPEAMAAADLVICRSGASTLGELAALGKPALLVPSPNVTNHHQEKNARLLERRGAARVLLEGAFTPDVLYDAVLSLLRDGPALAAMGGAMRASGVPDATDRIVARVLSCLR
jgi:UDP-N-acetylglucosamine--N-acetylmuramyl-(pentapeptide) pyrophosphoryl-undecaprenol N-acetylglucosamine transferase